MTVICQKCRTEYAIPDENIPPHGLQINCGKCAANIMVFPEIIEPVIPEAVSSVPAIGQIKCPSCTKLIPEGVERCPFCNKRISISFAVPKPVIPIAEYRQQKYFGIALLIAGIAGLVLWPLGVGAFIFSGIQLSKAKKNPLIYQDSIVYMRVVFWGYISVLALLILLIAGIILAF